VRGRVDDQSRQCGDLPELVRAPSDWTVARLEPKGLKEMTRFAWRRDDERSLHAGGRRRRHDHPAVSRDYESATEPAACQVSQLIASQGPVCEGARRYPCSTIFPSIDNGKIDAPRMARKVDPGERTGATPNEN